ncbi:hypothetical protein EMIT0P228_20722 [Pseudomonas brassicacearum]
MDFFSPFCDWFTFFDLDHDLSGNVQNAITLGWGCPEAWAMALARGFSRR